MFRRVALSVVANGRRAVLANNRLCHHQHFSPGTIQASTHDDLVAKYVQYFSRADIDGWEARKAMNDLQGLDMVPDPEIVVAALRACRRLNDYALAVRFLEAVKFKCGGKVDEIYPYVLQEIKPTLNELGINTPEEMGYDKPELYHRQPHEY